MLKQQALLGFPILSISTDANEISIKTQKDRFQEFLESITHAGSGRMTCKLQVPSFMPYPMHLFISF